MQYVWNLCVVHRKDCCRVGVWDLCGLRESHALRTTQRQNGYLSIFVDSSICELVVGVFDGNSGVYHCPDPRPDPPPSLDRVGLHLSLHSAQCYRVSMRGFCVCAYVRCVSWLQNILTCLSSHIDFNVHAGRQSSRFFSNTFHPPMNTCIKTYRVHTIYITSCSF